MAKIILDGVEYEESILDETAQRALSSSKYVGKKIEDVDMLIEALKIAKIAYVNELKKSILQKKAGLWVCQSVSKLTTLKFMRKT